MSKLFEMFQQIPAGQPRSGGGTGLGLAICKKLVEIQGGKIWAESHVGGRKRFQFYFAAGRRKLKVKSPKILLIEDNDHNAYLATYLLEASGCRIVWVKTGPQGVETAEKIKPDLTRL